MKKLTQMTERMKESYARLFKAALDSMEASNWEKPWVSANNGIPCNLYTRNKPYRGVNHFLLKMLCSIEGWETPYFLTFNEMNDDERKFGGLTLNTHFVLDANGLPTFDKQGMPVLQREGSFPVWKFLPRIKDKDGNLISQYDYEQMTEEEQQECRTFFMLRTYYVWNIDQTNFKELYPEDYAAMILPPEHEYKQTTIDPVLERMIMQPGEWRCPIEFGGHSACYLPSKDMVKLPQREKFFSDEAFYGMALHEMAHSTAKELKRSQDGSFGTEAYAMEEFIVELTSACVCSMLGVGKLLGQEHLSYVDSWRKAIKTDADFIPKVIDHVQRATNYILRRYEAIADTMRGPKMLTAATAA